MRDVQRIETGVLYILVGVDIRINALSVLVRSGLLAETILLMIIMTVCLMSVIAASRLVDMVGLLNLVIEKEQFIIYCFCIPICDLCYTLGATMSFHEFKLLLLCNLFYKCLLLTEKGCGDYQ